MKQPAQFCSGFFSAGLQRLLVLLTVLLQQLQTLLESLVFLQDLRYMSVCKEKECE